MKIVLNDQSFRYDVHSLVKAFYPSEELNYNIINRNISGEEPEIFFDDGLYIFIPKKLATDRTETKNIFKRKLYDILSKRTNTELFWGTLTGIRPIKILTKLIKENKDEVFIDNYLKETFYVSEKKRRLAMDIARSEYKLLSGIDMKETASLYVGIPFCPSICAYCSFSSYPYGLYKNRIEDYLKALKAELSYVAQNLKKKIITIYIGGGTPSTLSASELKDLTDFIKTKFKLTLLKELTVECGRPDSISKEKLQVLKDAGVSRISINPQSMNQKTLEIIGRAHNVCDVYESFEIARSVGIKTINCDLIAGLPGEGMEEIKYTLNKVKDLNPENLTVHSLAIKRSADFNLNERWENLSSVITEDIMEEFFDAADELEMRPYYLYRQKQMIGNFENVGFAKPGLECLYNCLIMGEYHDIIACGAGSVSKFFDNENKPVRVSNVKDVDVYIDRIDEMIERKKRWL